MVERSNDRGSVFKLLPTCHLRIVIVNRRFIRKFKLVCFIIVTRKSICLFQ